MLRLLLLLRAAQLLMVAHASVTNPMLLQALNRTLVCVTDELDGDGMVRLAPTTPAQVVNASLSLAEGEALDITAYAVGYNVDALKYMRDSVAGSNVSFNYVIKMIKPKALPSGMDKVVWALDPAGGNYDCYISTAKVTHERSKYVRYLTPSVSYGLIVTTTQPTVTHQSFNARMWSFLRPFSWQVWVVIVAMLVTTAIAISRFEYKKNRDLFVDTKGVGPRPQCELVLAEVAAAETAEKATAKAAESSNGSAHASVLIEVSDGSPPSTQEERPSSTALPAAAAARSSPQHLQQATPAQQQAPAQHSAACQWRDTLHKVTHLYIPNVWSAWFRSVSVGLRLESTGPYKSGLGRLVIASQAVVATILVATYTARLSAIFATDTVLYQPITSVADFTNKGLTACTRNNSDVDWLRRKYPQMQLLVVAGDNNPTTGEAVYSNIKQGLCAGAITTDTHARYSLMHSTATCGLQLVGQAVNFGYYAMAVRGTPDFEPVQRGLDVLMASFLENQADASYKTQFLTSTITCPAAPAVQQTTQMHISDLGGLFILQAAVLGLCFVWYISRKAVLRVGAARAAAEEAATKHRLKSQQQQRANSTATTAVVSQAQHARSEGNLTQRSPGSC